MSPHLLLDFDKAGIFPREVIDHLRRKAKISIRALRAADRRDRAVNDVHASKDELSHSKCWFNGWARAKGKQNVPR